MDFGGDGVQMDVQIAHQMARRRDLLDCKAELRSLQAHHEVTLRLKANRQMADAEYHRRCGVVDEEAEACLARIRATSVDAMPPPDGLQLPDLFARGLHALPSTSNPLSMPKPLSGL
jgi:hypothetical protein